MLDSFPLLYEETKMELRKFLNLSITLILFISTSNCSRPPHIIFILIDDLGWNDISFHGSKQIPTPNIDALAYDGVILNNYYVQPLCTPSRGTLMTGKYPIRLGLQHYVISADEPWGLSPEEIILPQRLKKLGYRTHGIGKWHLGYFHKDYIPTNRGFDSFFGYWNGKKDFYTHFEEGGGGACGLDLHDGEQNAWGYFGQYATDLFTEKAINVVKNHNASQPLFLYLSHEAVHTGNYYSPLQAPPSDVEKLSYIKDMDRRKFAGMVLALDKAIGNLLSTLKQTGMIDNSVIIFTTDNGAAVEGIDQSTGSNWPLRGSKYTLWEGGIRGVGFVWSPSIRNAESKISAAMMHMSDWLPTLYAVAGGNATDLGEIDGYNLWPSICCNVPSPRNVILHNIDEIWKVESIRKGKYKLVKGSYSHGKFDGWFSKEGKKQENTTYVEKDAPFFDEIYEELANESQAISLLFKQCSQNTSADETSNHDEGYCQLQNQISGGQRISDLSPTDSHDASNDKSALVVNCGTKPEKETTSCKPTENACLFDIEKDPCEYHNLAYSLPSVVNELEKLLNEYRALATPPRNKPSDPAANPKYHGYSWVPWKT